jgi:hypothetical protein
VGGFINTKSQIGWLKFIQEEANKAVDVDIMLSKVFPYMTHNIRLSKERSRTVSAVSGQIML